MVEISIGVLDYRCGGSVVVLILKEIKYESNIITNHRPTKKFF